LNQLRAERMSISNNLSDDFTSSNNVNHQIQILKRDQAESLEIAIARQLREDECERLRNKDA
jgi:hypothetical protein